MTRDGSQTRDKMEYLWITVGIGQPLAAHRVDRRGMVLAVFRDDLPRLFPVLWRFPFDGGLLRLDLFLGSRYGGCSGG